MEGLTPKDLLDKVSSNSDLGIVLISSGAAFATEESLDLLPLPSGPLALAVAAVLLGAKKLVESGRERAKRRHAAGHRAEHARLRATNARETLVAEGRFDLAEQLYRDLKLHFNSIIDDDTLNVSTDDAVHRFRSEPKENYEAASEWREVLEAARRADADYEDAKVGERAVELLRDGKMSFPDVERILRPWR